jgi:hypothetical protein
MCAFGYGILLNNDGLLFAKTLGWNKNWIPDKTRQRSKGKRETTDFRPLVGQLSACAQVEGAATPTAAKYSDTPAGSICDHIRI